MPPEPKLPSDNLDPSLGDILKDVRAASESITAAENDRKKSAEENKKSFVSLNDTLGTMRDDHKGLVSRCDGLETNMNEVLKRLNRPGAEARSDEDSELRKQA